MRYIDEDKLKADIKEVADITGGKLTAFEVFGIMSGQPTADVVPMDYHERCLSAEIQKRMNMVEVVRCKDCKWFNQINNGDHGYCGTPFHGAEVYEDDYCSDGEKICGKK